MGHLWSGNISHSHVSPLVCGGVFVLLYGILAYARAPVKKYFTSLTKNMLPTQTQKRSKKPTETFALQAKVPKRGRHSVQAWSASDMACARLLQQLQQDATKHAELRVSAAVKLQRAVRRTTILDKGFVVL